MSNLKHTRVIGQFNDCYGEFSSKDAKQEDTQQSVKILSNTKIYFKSLLQKHSKNDESFIDTASRQSEPRNVPKIFKKINQQEPKQTTEKSLSPASKYFRLCNPKPQQQPIFSPRKDNLYQSRISGIRKPNNDKLSILLKELEKNIYLNSTQVNNNLSQGTKKHLVELQEILRDLTEQKDPTPVALLLKKIEIKCQVTLQDCKPSEAEMINSLMQRIQSSGKEKLKELKQGNVDQFRDKTQQKQEFFTKIHSIVDNLLPNDPLRATLFAAFYEESKNYGISEKEWESQMNQRLSNSFEDVQSIYQQQGNKAPSLENSEFSKHV